MYKRESAFGRIVSFIRQSKTERVVFPWQKYTRQPYPSQEEMARELIVDPSTWRKIERGERKVDRDLVEKIAEVLQPPPTQEVLLFAFAELFEVGLMRYLGMPDHISSSFKDIDVEKKSLSELEKFVHRQIQAACLAIYPQVMQQVKERLLTWLTLLHQINNVINSGFELDQALTIVVGIVTKAMQVSHCSIFLFDEPSRKLVRRATNEPQMADSQSVTFALGEGIIGKVAQQGQTEQISDSSAGRSQLVMPILHFYPRDLLLGVISVQTTDTCMFSQEEIMLLELICGQLAMSIERRIACLPKRR
jgi:GAF domain-containing protein